MFSLREFLSRSLKIMPILDPWLTDTGTNKLLPKNRLTDETIISCTNLLMLAFKQTPAAVLSPHVYTTFIESTSGRRDVTLWNTARSSEFWRSDVLVIPINLKERKYWVVATVYLKE